MVGEYLNGKVENSANNFFVRMSRFYHITERPDRLKKPVRSDRNQSKLFQVLAQAIELASHGTIHNFIADLDNQAT